MVKPSGSDPSDDDEGIQSWQHQIHEGTAANPKQLQRTSYCKPARSEPDEARLSPTASPSERQMCVTRSFSAGQNNTRKLSPEPVGKQRKSTREGNYYEGVRAVNKEHHHTNDTGLIQVSESGGFRYLSRPVPAVSNAPVKGKSNPAMNDWVPAEENGWHGKVSSKPTRSELNVEFGSRNRSLLAFVGFIGSGFGIFGYLGIRVLRFWVAGLSHCLPSLSNVECEEGCVCCRAAAVGRKSEDSCPTADLDNRREHATIDLAFDNAMLPPLHFEPITVTGKANRECAESSKL